MINRDVARKYVGGHFDDSGKKQFDFLINNGIKPDHKLLEVGCGNCRAARFFIRYLNENNYFGLDHNQWLIDAAFQYELTDRDKIKMPKFLVNDDFNFSEINKIKFNFVLAKSVFTHLTKDKIKECLDNLKEVIKKDGIFFASIFVGDSSKNLIKSDDTRKFMYSIDEIKELADGWKVKSMGNAACYRQTMLRFTLKK